MAQNPLQDKIAAQLRSLQQQQREEDKHEFWTQLLRVLLVPELRFLAASLKCKNVWPVATAQQLQDVRSNAVPQPLGPDSLLLQARHYLNQPIPGSL